MNCVAFEQFFRERDGSYFVTWGWDKEYETQSYKVEWRYQREIPGGQHIWLIGSQHTLDPASGRQDSYSVPEEAEWVECWITPIAKTHKVDDTDVAYWTAQSANIGAYCGDAKTPSPPGTLSPEISPYNKNLLEVKFQNLKQASENKDVTNVEIHLVKNTKDGKNTLIFRSINVSEYGTAKFTYTLEDGCSYMLRARCVAGGQKIASEWTEWSDEFWAPPLAPKIKNIRAETSSSVFVEWDLVQNSLFYEVEYTENEMKFESGQPGSAKTKESDQNSLLIDGLTPNVYYFRIRSITHDDVTSAWSNTIKLPIGKRPSAPTTWSEKNVLYFGESETVRLYWIHNSPDNSKEIQARVTYIINGFDVGVVIVPKEKNEYGEYDKTSHYDLDISELNPGDSLEWFVDTVGCDIALGYGDKSVSRKITVYSKPEMSLTIENLHIYDESDIPEIDVFPIHFTTSVTAGGEQKITGYYVTVVSSERYSFYDSLGNISYVNENDVVFSRYYDVHENLDAEISASDIVLNNGRKYKLKVTVSMSSGLTDTAEHEFRMHYEYKGYDIQVSMGFNKDSLTAYICPYVRYHDFIPDNIEIAIYRVDRDKSMKLIASGIRNSVDNFIVDPHPTFKYMVYRVVARDVTTNEIIFYDTPEYPSKCTDIVIQWDETTRNAANIDNENEITPVVNGSFIRLPYNVDVSESTDVDVNHIKYIGRQHPVSYFGTHLGYSASWSSEIPKTDVETINKLRELQVYTGNVYVREPSGTGFWASVKVSFNINHLELTVPVTLDLTKVEGGM